MTNMDIDIMTKKILMKAMDMFTEDVQEIIRNTFLSGEYSSKCYLNMKKNINEFLRENKNIDEINIHEFSKKQSKILEKIHFEYFIEEIQKKYR